MLHLALFETSVPNIARMCHHYFHLDIDHTHIIAVHTADIRLQFSLVKCIITVGFTNSYPYSGVLRVR
jgi:hypothetical protein